MKLEDLFEDNPTPEPPLSKPPDPLQAFWRKDGKGTLPRLIPDDLIEAYCDAYVKRDLATHNASDVTPYMRIPELREICTYGPLSDILEHIIGEPMGVHLNLIGWTSTERDWHQDHYLNPPGVGSFYAAVWIALEDIDPRSGPFQYIPGSHKWGSLDREKVIAACGSSLSDPDWPRHSEKVLTPLVEAKIKAEGLKVQTYLPKKGDVLIWHSRLMHRGSKPEVPGLQRRALIAHYSGINHRSDMAPAERWGDGWIFPF